MHPLEVHEAKGTGHLLHACLPHSRLLIGERFEAGLLHQALHAPWEPGARPRHSLLLYPETDVQNTSLGLIQPPALPAPWPCQPEVLRLVVLDGTWRKSRKMLFINPGLQSLPRLALSETPASAYAIRKAHAPGQLSSFEATALALARLQAWPPDAAPVRQLAQVFAAFIQSQQRQRSA